MGCKSLIKKNAYYDSVTLMIITKEIESVSGVKNAVVVMGTEHNKELLGNVGLLNEETEKSTPNDLVIAVALEEDIIFDDIVSKVEQLLSRRSLEAAEDYSPRTLEAAIKSMEDSNLVLISLPGQYAAAEAKKALKSNKHVLLFSDNVTLEEELELKQLAVEKGLLMMGPDCGTAVINGIPLAFANVVRKGSIGIIGASGTGTQEIMVQIHRFGGGISQAIGTGGRDLKAEIGGRMMMQSIEALGQDENTQIIVLVSKPPAPEIAERVLIKLKETGKLAVVDFIGGDEERIRRCGFIPASTLEDAAYKAVRLSETMNYELCTNAPDFSEDLEKVQQRAMQQANLIKAGGAVQKYLRGLYSGGTLCDEALKLFARENREIYSNIPLTPEYKLPVKGKSYKNSAIDLGDDEYTVGRPHPMIDSYTRQQMILEEAKDAETAVLLLDIVLGYGSNEDPAGSILSEVKKAQQSFKERGQHLCVVACICGTKEDPQNYDLQKEKLEQAGVIVMQSNAQAVRFAIKVIDAIHNRAQEAD